MYRFPFRKMAERVCCILGYLKDSNAAAHSVDSDIFYAVIYLQFNA